MAFHLGKPIFVLTLLALATGALLLAQKSPPRADLVLWTFADSHAHTYRDSIGTAPSTPSLVDQFHSLTGHTIQVDLLAQRAEDVRLISMFMSHAAGSEVPDLCEIESGSVGKFFRPPVDEVGFLPLNDYLARSGDINRILPSRLAPWTKKDPRTGATVIFGVPHDVHPMTITYRKDLFDEAGIDPSQARTWPEFQHLCLALQQYRSSHGHPDSLAIELPTTAPDMLLAMLLQRHINLIDNADHLFLNDPQVAKTLAFYTQLVVGPNRIGSDVSNTAAFGTQDLLHGDVCALCTPDWRAGYVKQYAPDLAGKLRMMPLPRFDPNDAPTSTWGGTMICITRACKNPDLAWKLIQLFYLSPNANAARIASGSGILPPLPDLWNDPVYHQPDPFYGNQKVYELYVQLARQIPNRFITPYSMQASIALAMVMNKAENYLKTRGPDGLEEACAHWLSDAQDELQTRINFGKFEP